MFSKVFLIAAAAGAVTAQMPKREVLEARQTDFSPKCQSALNGAMDLVTGIPTPPEVFATMTITDPCETPDVTGSALSQYNSYTSALSSFLDEHKEEYEAVASACSADIPEVTEVPVCTATARPGSGTDSADNIDDSIANDDTGVDDEDEDEEEGDGNAASRNGGVLLAAVAAAGLMGAVALL
ncbi:hypothetical protein GGS20DRAFT_424460 [Poronia punctata]|nr:hypothetical protein GGS20DRAFT_424460 [Poronia punctata]